MDTLAGLLDGPRARGAFLLRCVMEPPWSIRIEDRAPLSLTAMVRGHAWVLPEHGDPVRLGPGDVVINRGPDPYTFADELATAPQAVIGPGGHCCTPDGAELAETMGLGVRSGRSTSGADPPRSRRSAGRSRGSSPSPPTQTPRWQRSPEPTGRPEALLMPPKPNATQRWPPPERPNAPRRSDEAEREAARAHGSVEQLRGELDAAREGGERQQVEVGRLGTELATATAQLAAARELLKTTKTHAAERVADLRRQLDPPTGRGD
ncbi:MAG: cupin domain-containing protein [Actinomycetota bacterium]|nr:cupin domain-containing protein [Actinomycetota bacterium]